MAEPPNKRARLGSEPQGSPSGFALPVRFLAQITSPIFTKYRYISLLYFFMFSRSGWGKSVDLSASALSSVFSYPLSPAPSSPSPRHFTDLSIIFCYFLLFLEELGRISGGRDLPRTARRARARPFSLSLGPACRR